MFALWYGAIFYRAYKDAIWEKISGVKGKPATKETAVVCPLPPKKPETSRIPVPGVVRSPSPQLAPREPSSPKTPRSRSPFQPPVSSTPIPPDDMKINISKSIIRSPSPHPSQSESFEDIEYEDEEENDTSDVEEDDENSIIYSMPSVGSSSSSDFVRNEIVKNQNQTRKSTTMVDAAVLEKLETGFKKLKESDSKSLLKKHLTQEVFDNLKTKKTPTFGSTLLDCIQSGLENLDSGVGIYAPDAEAYSVFADIFDPIIEDYHAGFKKTDKHPPKNWGDVSVFGDLDPAGEFVVSTRVRCGRSLEGYPFNPCLTEEQYKEMEQKVSSTLSGLEGELKGTFYPLTGMSKDTQQKLIDDHFLFKEGDRFLQAANACRFWPTGRGIYHNDAKTFLVWCNEEDHLRIISMQMGGDLGAVFRRLVTGVNDIEKRLPFSHHDRLGFLTFCPTNLGTTVRASVHIKVPKLAANKAKLEEVASKYNLQVRGTRGEHTEAEGGIYDISNKRRMGLTEFDAVKEMYDGIQELIKIEKEL